MSCRRSRREPRPVHTDCFRCGHHTSGHSLVVEIPYFFPNALSAARAGFVFHCDLNRPNSAFRGTRRLFLAQRASNSPSRVTGPGNSALYVWSFPRRG